MKNGKFYQKGNDIINHDNKGKISAIIPIYGEDGRNCSRIIFEDGTELIRNTSVKASIGLLFRLHGLDLKTLQRYYGEFFESIHIPLPITYKTIMIPLRLREPLGKHDGAIGYINYYHIDDLEVIEPKDILGKEEVYITLNCEKKIKVHQIPKTTRTKINQSKLVAILFSKNFRDDCMG